MTRSAEDIERDVEATRGDLDRTVEALKEKMTPGNMASEMIGSIRNSPVGTQAVRLGHQAQDNALPLALMGAGLAWMFFNARRGAGHEARSFRPARRLDGADRGAGYEGAPESGYLGAEYEPESSSRTAALRQKARRLTDTAKDAVGEGAARVRQRAARYGHRAEETFMETLDREPLILGALGLAVGAAVGAALPATPIEDRYVGPLRDRALDEGKTRARKGIRQAREVASAAADTLKQEAQTQGFTDVQGLVEKVEQVARAGVDTVKREVENRRGH